MAPLPIIRSLWMRIKPALAPLLPAASGLNQRLRCYRYKPGDSFLPHYDASQHRATLDEDGQQVQEYCAQRSKWSLLLYLNGGESFVAGSTLGFDGGATALLPGGEAGAPIHVEPHPGSALIFPHGDHPRSLLHAGEPVLAGTKFVIRTDVF